MGRAFGFHGDVDGGIAEIDAVIGAIIRGLDDVGAMVGEDSGQAMQRAGIVRKMNAQANQATVFDQAALYDPREQCDVDVAAADKNRNAFAAEPEFSV